MKTENMVDICQTRRREEYFVHFSLRGSQYHDKRLECEEETMKSSSEKDVIIGEVFNYGVYTDR